MNKWNSRLFLSAGILVCCFAYIFVITLVPGAKQNDMVTGVVIGTGLNTVVNFYFGSSDKKGKEVEEK